VAENWVAHLPPRNIAIREEERWSDHPYGSIQPDDQIRLVAVAGSHQRRGLGDRLVQGAIHTAARNGFRRLQVGTQIANLPAVRLYERNGFRLQDVKYRLHLWLKDHP
jgi:ribosomal protein S18 acetylase RimI-like enzyme